MTKKEKLMEQENIAMETETSQAAGTDTSIAAESTDGMDLNELLENMNQESDSDSDTEDVPLPEISEDEIFGESVSDSEPEAALPEDTKPERPTPVKSKRSTDRRKKSSETTDTAEESVEQNPVEDTVSDPSADTAGEVNASADAVPETDSSATAPDTVSATPPASGSSGRARRTEAPVLTLENRGEIETDESKEDAIWHEIHNAYRTRKILTGQLGGIEQTDNGKTIVIVDYKGFRIVIPLKEMMINVGRSPSREEYRELMLRQNKILCNMLGAEIDFMVRGIDSKTRSVVASRREAMLKKRQIFYFDTDSAGIYRIYEGRIVQARVIAVAEKVVRVEVFGVECSIMARDLAWDWIGDAHERFSVGDQILVRILSVRRDSVEYLSIKADIKSVSQKTNHDNLKKCRIQSKYAGKVTDVHKGVVYIHLSNGVNAVAHSCYDYRTPGKKDDVSFAVTRIDEERGVAVGIITRIIRQNL